MRWPLKYQIALPMAAVMLLAIAAASGLNAYVAGRGTLAAIEDRVQSAASIVTEANFPLTDGVLRQLHGLSGADFLVIHSEDQVTASSAAGLSVDELPRTPGSGELALKHRVHIAGREYFHAGLPLRRRGGSTEGETLHVLYPIEEYRAAWQSAVFPSLGVLLIALPVGGALAVLTAARISRRIDHLQDQLRRIAAGDFRATRLPRRHDELRDLAEGVNQTAAMLAGYEDQVRTSERMQTLLQLGGAVAHQLRNAVTGCRLALHFHAEDCPRHADEGLEVARRQLGLMEEYVRRFLQLGKAESSGIRERIDLARTVDEVLSLVAPAARHAGVRVQRRPPEGPALVWADPSELNQLLINLLLNAIEAASQPAGRNGGAAEVRVELHGADGERLRLAVSDTGPGPAPGVSERLFEPFVSEKKDGVGLGLSVVRAIAKQHQGDVRWERSDGWTRFIVELPQTAPETLS